MRPQTYVSGTIIFLHLYVWFKYQVHKISIIQITHDHWIPWHERGRKTCLFWRSKSKRYRSWLYNCPFTVIMETETIEYCAKCLFYVITLGSMHLAMYSILAKWHFSFHKNYCFSIHKTFLLLNTYVPDNGSPLVKYDYAWVYQFTVFCDKVLYFYKTLKRIDLWF